jgi:DNA invertase Pin-like site-specific DNA recombinase
MTPPTAFPPRPARFSAEHLQRSAVVYVRQSSPFQVQHNTGSTARQYSLQDLALAWGWPQERIIVVDDDLGLSGSKIGVRMGFPQMLTLIKRGQVSAVFTVHVDRLARNLLEFAELATACEYAHVPWVVDGRVIDLEQGNDRLTAMMLGVFADYENRDRMHKLHSSRLAKVSVHKEALGPPPAGYEAPSDPAPTGRRRRWGTQWQKDADPAVRLALTEVFARFRELRTVGAVVRVCQRQGLRCPGASCRGRTTARLPSSPSPTRACMRS